MTAFSADRSTEYYELQKIITQFNADRTEVKKWSSGAFGLIVTGLGLADVPLPTIGWVLMMQSLAFWMTEAAIARTQSRFIPRVIAIEEGCQDAPQISSSYAAARRGGNAQNATSSDSSNSNDWFARLRTMLPHVPILSNDWFANAFRLRTMLPHVPILIAGAILACGVLSPAASGQTTQTVSSIIERVTAAD